MEPRSIDEVPVRLRQWPTWLLGRVHSDAKRMIAPRLAERGLHLHHYAVLACIAEFAPLSQQQVCERLDVDRADMVTIVDHLQAQKLVSRHPGRRRSASLHPDRHTTGPGQAGRGG